MSIHIIGTDEAGYGPNLGPLVVSGTAWHVEDIDRFEDFFVDMNSQGIPLGDSKKVYHAGGSLAPLETSVLGALRLLGYSEETDRTLLKRFVTDRDDGKDDPTFEEPEIALPVAATEQEVHRAFRQFRLSAKNHGIRLRGLESRILFPAEFNALLDQQESKGALLSRVTLHLYSRHFGIPEVGHGKPGVARRSSRAKPCARTGDGIPRRPVKDETLVFCDKHGGRNKYLDLLHEEFPDDMIWTLRESREESAYRLQLQERSVEFRFLVKGESQVPIALASMISKYFRELAMLRFNRYWQRRVPGLRPTAGYPGDARRFKKEIAEAQAKLGIEDERIWRRK